MKGVLTLLEFDVIIVGYGPTGEVLAAVLGKAGHRVAVVERWPQLYGLPRLTHIDDETARIVQSVADIDVALRDSEGIQGYSFLNGAGEILIKIGSAQNGPSGFKKDISIFQPDIDAAINETVKACPNVELFLGWDAVELNAHGHSPQLTIARAGEGGAGERQVLAGRYLVGCDGARSFVRTAVGATRTDYGFNERWCTIDAERQRDLDPIYESTMQYCDPTRGHMHMAIGTKRVRFELALLPHEDPDEFLTAEFAWKWLAETHGLGPADLKIIRHIVYTFEARIADQWRFGSVLLAGDAAHTMPPYLGQGACSGMRDGINIGWKLDLILRGLADGSLLDTVEAERKPHVTTITHNAIMLGKIANEHDPERARQRDEKLRSAPPSIPLTPNVLGGLIAAETALAGTIWPQGNIGFNGETGRFDTVVGNGFLLLANTSTTNALGTTRLNALKQLGCRMIALDDPGFQDLDGVYAGYFSENGIAAFIARPDFVVFGSVSQLGDLPDLIDRMLDGLQRPTTIEHGQQEHLQA